VLILRPEAKGRGTGKVSAGSVTFQKIMVPIDFSDFSMEALEYAKSLAREFRSTLVLLHSVYLQYYIANDEYARYDFPSVMENLEKFAQEQMHDLVTNTDWEGIKVESTLEVGHAGEQICDRAKDRNADLIISATHGRTGLKHALIGSTAEYVVRHAGCSVLVVPTRPVKSPG
jgi:nucleotide-binding universal stress UspA family protein